MKDKNCGYFRWCDKLREDEIRKSQPEFNFPTCGCGAGVCTVRVEESGPNAGRKYFACPIKKVIDYTLQEYLFNGMWFICSLVVEYD